VDGNGTGQDRTSGSQPVDLKLMPSDIDPTTDDGVSPNLDPVNKRTYPEAPVETGVDEQVLRCVT
jgi:hypothetical protein